MNRIRDLPYNNVVAPFFAKGGKKIMGLRLLKAGSPDTLLIVTRSGYVSRQGEITDFSDILRWFKEEGFYPLPPNLRSDHLFDHLFVLLNRIDLTYDLPIRQP